jgi:hypothetical protein
MKINFENFQKENQEIRTISNAIINCFHTQIKTLESIHEQNIEIPKMIRTLLEAVINKTRKLQKF